MPPTTAAQIAAMSTAPAAQSLALLAKGLHSSVTRSTTDSTAVFTSSSPIIRPNSTKQKHHSVLDISKINPKIITSTANLAEKPEPISSSKIFPNSKYTAVPWSDNVKIQTKTVGTNEMLYVSTEKRYDGLHFDFGKTVSMDKFTSLVVEFEPGTCAHTAVYFDAKDTGNPNLGNYSLQNGIANKILPLSQIIKTEVTPNHSLSASRLKIQATRDNETCNIKAIYLQ